MPKFIPISNDNTPANKFLFYFMRHPECHLMTKDAILSIMVEKRIINAEEANRLKLDIPNLIDQFELSKKHNKYPTNFESKIAEPEAKQTPIPLKVPNFHKEFTDLIIKDNGQIDMSQFDMNNLKNRFRSDKYGVRYETKKDSAKGESFGYINIIDKSGNIFATINFSPNTENVINYSVATENGRNSYTIKNGKVTQFSKLRPNYSQNKFYDDNGELKEVNYYDVRKNTNRNITYSGEYPFLETINGKEKNLLAQDLYEDISAKTKLGVPTTRSSINKNVLKRINNKNVYKLLNDYKKKYGNDLMDDIKSEIGLKKEVREKLINHIKNCMKNSLKEYAEEAGEYIANLLAEDIYGIGSGNLEKDIYLINKDNVGYAAKKYLEIAEEKYYEARKKHNPIDIPFTDITINPAMAIAPIEGLIESINMEFGLDQEVIDKLIKHIKDCALKSGYKTEDVTFYTKDIVDDIKTHDKDINKLNIDINRLSNRHEVSNDYTDSNFVSANGKIDEKFRQGHIGDCWLVAGISAILECKGGKEVIENLLDYDEKTGNVTVNLKGFNKKYTITAEEIKNFNQLSIGDGDIRAIEIALDRYLKECAYEDENFDYFDIDGNHTSFLFKALLGNAEELTIEEAISKNVLNKKDIVLALGSAKNSKDIKATIEKNGVRVNIMERHAYAIVKSDSKYIYLKDPGYFTNITTPVKPDNTDEDSLNTNKEPAVLKVLKQDLADMNPVIYTAKLN